MDIIPVEIVSSNYFTVIRSLVISANRYTNPAKSYLKFRSKQQIHPGLFHISSIFFVRFVFFFSI